MEHLIEFILFAAKTVTVVALVAVPLLLMALASTRFRQQAKEHIEVNHLNKRYEAMSETIAAAHMQKKERKEERKKKKKEEKRKRKETESDGRERRRVYVFGFEGDIQASAIDTLREEITAVLTLKEAPDEVVVKVESTGGAVHAYGLAASQLARLRSKGIPLTVAVDKVAASGGYMMACVADKILAAPFAIVGSIGVLAQIPNFHRALEKREIDYHEFTAGEYKRTVGMFTEPTEKGKEKLKEEIEDVHSLFKDFVQSYRPSIDLDKVGTGEHWHGTRAVDLNLVDEIRTSDDYLLESSAEADIYEIKLVRKMKIAERIRPSFLAFFRSLLGRGDERFDPYSRY